MNLEGIQKLNPFDLAKKEKDKLYLSQIKSLNAHHYKFCKKYKKILNNLNFKVKNNTKLEDFPMLPVRIFKDFEMKNSEIRKKIQENGFKTAANIYSISDTAKFGGRIGFINESQLSQKILDEIKSINSGEITNTINVPNGYLILKLDEIIVEEFKKDLNQELINLIKFETDRQLNQYSIIYFNKIKLNSKIN